MIYKPFGELRLSALGFGCMRLPTASEKASAIDEAQTEAMIACAMERGINYYDTAWGYHEGNSERVIGRLLGGYPRDSFYLATKFPGYDLANMDKAEPIFEQQLKKCGVDYFDFYLCHNVNEMNIDAYLDPKNGIFDYLMRKKEKGRIRHLGFSAHGNLATIERFLGGYGSGMEFCQIQLNWLDWIFEKAKDKVEFLNRKQIPIWVMEPLRGGKLVQLDADKQAALRTLRPAEGIAGWSFRFLQTIPGVTMVLSGMSDMGQLQQNLDTFETEQPLSDEEMTVLFKMADELTAATALPCTGCRYCTAHCPRRLDIPTLLRYYNTYRYTGVIPRVFTWMPKEQQPAGCAGCKSCEPLCPQQIKIAEVMAEFAAAIG